MRGYKTSMRLAFKEDFLDWRATTAHLKRFQVKPLGTLNLRNILLHSTTNIQKSGTRLISLGLKTKNPKQTKPICSGEIGPVPLDKAPPPTTPHKTLPFPDPLCLDS